MSIAFYSLKPSKINGRDDLYSVQINSSSYAWTKKQVDASIERLKAKGYEFTEIKDTERPYLLAHKPRRGGQ